MTETPSEVAEGFDEPLLNCVQNLARAFHIEIPRDARVKGGWPALVLLWIGFGRSSPRGMEIELVTQRIPCTHF